MSKALIIVLVVVLLAVIVAAALAALRFSRTRRLRSKFGPEYDRVVTDAPNRGKAEERLLERERRHAELDLKPLSDTARERYIREWTAVQERFVDAPAASTRDADGLITELMRDRGYPVENFEQRLADLSVEHAHTLEHYRTAHEIGGRISGDEAQTEEMRQAMVHYRELFADLLKSGGEPGVGNAHDAVTHDPTAGTGTTAGDQAANLGTSAHSPVTDPGATTRHPMAEPGATEHRPTTEHIGTTRHPMAEAGATAHDPTATAGRRTTANGDIRPPAPRTAPDAATGAGTADRPGVPDGDGLAAPRPGTLGDDRPTARGPLTPGDDHRAAPGRAPAGPTGIGRRLRDALRPRAGEHDERDAETKDERP